MGPILRGITWLALICSVIVLFAFKPYRKEVWILAVIIVIINAITQRRVQRRVGKKLLRDLDEKVRTGR